MTVVEKFLNLPGTSPDKNFAVISMTSTRFGQKSINILFSRAERK